MRQTSRLLAGLALAAALLPGAALAGGPDPAPAADDGTDRLIIRYRPGVPGAARSAPAADRTRLHRGAEAAAARFGRRLQWVRAGAFDTHVMRLDGRVGRDEAVRLSNEIARSDSSVESTPNPTASSTPSRHPTTPSTASSGTTSRPGAGSTCPPRGTSPPAPAWWSR